MEQGGEKWSGVDVEAIHPKSEKVGGHCFLALRILTKACKQQKSTILRQKHVNLCFSHFLSTHSTQKSFPPHPEVILESLK